MRIGACDCAAAGKVAAAKSGKINKNFFTFAPRSVSFQLNLVFREARWGAGRGARLRYHCQFILGIWVIQLSRGTENVQFESRGRHLYSCPLTPPRGQLASEENTNGRTWLLGGLSSKNSYCFCTMTCRVEL